MTGIEEKIGYNFKNKALLQNALTHSSYANEHHEKSNERLEFLGDSVLSIIMSDYLYKRMSKINEGDLSKLRASLVCEQSLDKAARRIGLHEAIKLGRGEEMTGGRERPSIVSDAFEAVLAAIYLDSDINTASKWLLSLMRGDIEEAVEGRRSADYKTELQERIQKNHSGVISYELEKEEGQAHLKKFTVSVMIDDRRIGTGTGGSKKEAEQHAAKMALDRLCNGK